MLSLPVVVAVVVLPRSPEEWERVVPIEQAELKQAVGTHENGISFKSGPLFDIESKEYKEAARSSS